MTKRNKYTIGYFIRKFARTKPGQWCRFVYEDCNGRHCALGFCGWVHGKDADPPAEACALEVLFFRHDLMVNHVNDGELAGNWTTRFRKAGVAKTPRGRVLAALRQMQTMKAKGATAC